jgi:hypothetical protein
MHEKIEMTQMHNAGYSMQPLLLERRSESDSLMESEALKIAETPMRLIADMGEIDLDQEWIASSRLAKASTTHSNQNMDKIGHAVQLKIPNERLICLMTPITGTSKEEIDLNLVEQPGLTGCRSLLEQRLHKAN